MSLPTMDRHSADAPPTFDGAVVSSLGRLHTRRRPPETVAREGWRDLGIFAVSVEDPRLDDLDRAMIRGLAKRLFGIERREREG